MPGIGQDSDMYSLPPFFHFVFVVFEPISTFGGFVYSYLWPAKFLAEQIPSTSSQIIAITPNVEGTILQLANCYLLLAMCSTAVLRTTSEKSVVRNYLIALLLADIGHLYFTWTAIGTELFFNPSKWNALTAGNVGVTALLFLTRILYLTGWGSSSSAMARNKIK